MGGETAETSLAMEIASPERPERRRQAAQMPLCWSAAWAPTTAS